MNLTNNLNQLIKDLLEIGNITRGTQLPFKDFYLAEGLGQKILNHAMSVQYLYNGYQAKIDNIQYEAKVDISSIFVLARAAIETYLTLNHVFVAGGDSQEMNFRFICWDLAGYLERANLKAVTEEHIALKEQERKSIEELIDLLKSNDRFNSLSKKEQGRVLNGTWKLKPWPKLAVDAGFNENYFKIHYGLLCAYAHSSRLSIIQIKQAKDFSIQKELAENAIAILMVVVAKYIYDYLSLIPNFKNIDFKREYPLAHLYKTIGEKIEL